MDATFYLGIFISALGIVLLIAILRAGKQKAAPAESALDVRGRVALRDDAPPTECLARYCAMAVRAVEQKTREGDIPKNNQARHDLAAYFVACYALADGHKLTDGEREAADSMIYAEVHRLRELTVFDYHPPDDVPGFTLRTPEDALSDDDVQDGIDLNSLTYEQLMIFAMDNGFGTPEDGELHGQCKAEIRQSMLDWLEGKMTRDQGQGIRDQG